MNPLNLAQWIEEHRGQLKPPVGNAQIWKDREFMVTIVGGPNSRKDYHIDPGEEFFYQIEGDMILRIMEDGKPRDMPIRQGEVFLLPPYVPHSPQRVANTVGMVIERVRRHDEEDHFHWYCDNCHHLLHDVHFHLTDITTQLAPVFEKFWADDEARHCKKCGQVLQKP
jgi:3-hydroxyanthranilate 3,4-dioxygenase